MSSDQPRRRESRSPSGSPAGSAAAIVIAIVAVVVGFLIIREIRDDDGGTAIDPVATDEVLPSTTADALAAPTTTVALETTTTVFTPVTEGAIVVVANASTVNGAAGVLTTALSGKGFTMAEATNAAAKQDASTVLYNPTDPEAQSVAMSIAVLMGNIAVAEISTPAPTKDGTLPEGVSVLVMLGSDKANQTLDAMSSAVTTVPATTAPGGVATSTSAPG